MSSLTLFGLPTCDTCRKARKALVADGHGVTLRDVRSEPLTSEEAGAFLAEFGEALLNRKSTTWRGLSETERQGAPATLLAAHPALMKRPVITDGARRSLGWSDEIRASWA